MNCDYVRNYYKVPAEIGRRISWRGRGGIISEDRGNYIGVTFDDEKPGTVHNLHPQTDGLEYLKMGVVRKTTAGQERYQKYLAADYFDGTFAEWLGIYRRVGRDL